MKNWMGLTGLALALACATAVPAANAHHSAAAFDRSKPYTLKGTIKSWEWGNPHIWVDVLVARRQGRRSALYVGRAFGDWDGAQRGFVAFV
jgi:hypothetical protein